MTMTFSDGCLRIFPNDYPMMEVGESTTHEPVAQQPYTEQIEVTMHQDMEYDWDKAIDLLMSGLGR